MRGRTSGASDVGLRGNQEDVWKVCEREGARMLVVCDGLSSWNPAAGIEAAERLIANLENAFLTGGVTDELVRSIVRTDAELAALGAAAKARGAPIYQDPGEGLTTVDVAVFTVDAVWLAHLGNGRTYHLRGDQLRLLTVDHTLRNEHRKLHPRATEEEIKALPDKVLVRSVGPGGRASLVDTERMRTLPGDVFLLCTDGISDAYSELELTALLERIRETGAGAELLIEPVPGRRSRFHDNATALVHVVL